MCGIVGCVGKIWKGEEDAFKLMLQLDTVRGPHSTGVVSVGTKHDNWEYLKVAGTPWDLFDAKGWSAFNARAHRALIGHNRWATKGAITNDNAHPFHHGNYVGVHNGTLTSQWRLKDHAKFEVDSENIYYNMNEEGVEETISKLNGAFALVWYNIKDGLLQICRNKERPLFICKSEDGKTYFWASEAWMLRVALGKSGIKHSDPVEVKDGELVTFEIPEGDISKLENYLPRTRAVELYKPPETSTWNGEYNYRSGSHYAHRRQAGTANVVPFVQPGVGSKQLRGYLNKVVTFSVVGQRQTHGMQYILCEVDDNLAPDIRVFVKADTKLGKLLLSSNKFFTARVKGLTSKEQHGNYLTVDHRTLVEVDAKQMQLLTHQVEDEDAERVMLSHNNGRMVTLETWYKKTESGCSWCSDFPKPEEAGELMWLADNQFLCRACATDQQVLQYLQ